MIFLKRFACGLLALIGAMSAGASAFAQQIDPSVLSQIQRQLGSDTGQITTSSPIDSARRDRGSDTQNAADFGLQRTVETPSERALRELEARNKLDTTRTVLPVERDYQQRLNDRKLRLFGYDLFEAGAARRSGPLTGQMADSYVLGVGDEIILQLRGSTNRSASTRVDREGRVIIDQLPPIVAAGRTLGAVQRDIERNVRATLLGTDAYVSVGTVRTITVLVSGEVNTPGAQALTSLDDVVAAILNAGGIRRGGSLRSIRVARGRSTILVDLYGLMGLAPAPRVRLQDGDRIVVPPLGRTVALTGAVARPGIYELPSGGDGMSLRAAVEMAGGTIRPRGNRYSISRISSTGMEQVFQARETGSAVKAGDAIVVTPQERGVVGQVRLSGAVDSPGVRALESAPTVGALLGGARSALKTGSYLPFAVLQRIDPVTNAQEMEPVSLISVFSGADVALRSGDELFVLDQTAIRFLQSDFMRQAVLGAADGPLPCRSMEVLRASVTASQSDRFIDLLRGAFLIDHNGRTSATTSGADVMMQNRLNRKDQQTDQDMLEALPAQQVQALKETDPAAQALKSARNRALASEDEGLDENGCALLFEENDQLLPFILENLVVISGAVRMPGAYPLADTLPLPALISVAGGYSTNANRGEVEIVDVLGDRRSSLRRVLALDSANERGGRVAVTAGDDVRVPSLTPVYEPGAVLLSGEVSLPGLYSVRKGETLADLIKRAGGLTDQAYAYGAVFTRRSVKQAQQEGFKRTSRELNSALLAVTARRNVSADGIAAAAALARSFEEVDAAGRVVVEADPRVLAQRADLNTVLEAGDAVFFPKRPNFIITVGDVLNPGALQFTPGKTVTDYLKESGGVQKSADDRRIFLVYPNGAARPVSLGAWTRNDLIVPPGSTIVVPKNIDPLRGIELVRDLATIIGQLAVSIASVAVLATN